VKAASLPPQPAPIAAERAIARRTATSPKP